MNASYLGAVLSTYFLYRILKFLISRRLALSDSNLLNWFLLLLLTNLSLLSIQIIWSSPSPIIFNIVIVNLITTAIIFFFKHQEPLLIETSHHGLAYFSLSLLILLSLSGIKEYRGMETYQSLTTKARLKKIKNECVFKSQKLSAKPDQYCDCLLREQELVRIIRKSKEKNIDKNIDKFMNSADGQDLMQLCVD